MFIQIFIGSILLLLTIGVAGVSFWMMETTLYRLRNWLLRPPHRPKLMVVLCLSAIWILVQMTIGIWLWALTFLGLGVFGTLEASVYFSLVAFTTLGFGDVLLPVEWRLLSGMAAANGLLNIGLVTAFLVEGLRQVRLRQIAALEDKT
jgi:uncharacterized membrane-anchored protein